MEGMYAVIKRKGRHMSVVDQTRWTEFSVCVVTLYFSDVTYCREDVAETSLVNNIPSTKQTSVHEWLLTTICVIV